MNRKRLCRRLRRDNVAPGIGPSPNFGGYNSPTLDAERGIDRVKIQIVELQSEQQISPWRFFIFIKALFLYHLPSYSVYLSAISN
jgi:hypothetical protein